MWHELHRIIMALPVVNQNHIKNYVTTMLPSKFIKKAFVSSSFNHWFTDFLDFFASKVGLYHLQIDVAVKACVLRLNRKVLIRNFWWPKCYIDFVVPWILSVHRRKLLNFQYILSANGSASRSTLSKCWNVDSQNVKSGWEK